MSGFGFFRLGNTQDDVLPKIGVLFFIPINASFRYVSRYLHHNVTMLLMVGTVSSDPWSPLSPSSALS